MKRKLLVSFSGGRTSAYMMWWILTQWPERHKWEIIVVFANTGKEREETLHFVESCSVHWGIDIIWVEAKHKDEAGIPFSKKGWKVKHKVVTHLTASRNGEPFEEMISVLGIPNTDAPFCSDQLKRIAIESYLKSIGWKRYYKALGIRADEPQRLHFEKARKKRVIYFLATVNKSTLSDVNIFWSKQSFDLGLKSYEGNCDFCWKKATRKLMTIAKESVDLTKWWKEMESKYETKVGDSRKENPNRKPPLRFFRGNLSISDIIRKSELPFEASRDESKDIDKYKQMSFMDMVNAFDYELDLQDDGCAETCEPFVVD
jgi:hypothetical protein